ncbi:hypothetical protein [Nocardia sp. NPDC005825]
MRAADVLALHHACPHSDLDIAVHRRDADRVHEILTALGYLASR